MNTGKQYLFYFVIDSQPVVVIFLAIPSLPSERQFSLQFQADQKGECLEMALLLRDRT